MTPSIYSVTPTDAAELVNETSCVQDEPCPECEQEAVAKGKSLAGADLTAADLSCANLTGADLDGADLDGANLSRAWLTDANLSRANLTGANWGCPRFVDIG